MTQSGDMSVLEVETPIQEVPKPSAREFAVQAVLDKVRPALRRDGGDCQLLEIKGSRVYVRLTGACVFCKLASATLEGIQSQLMEALGEFIVVVPVAGAPQAKH